MPVASAPCAVLTSTKPITNKAHSLATAVKANIAASNSAEIQTSRRRPITSEPTPDSRLPKIPPTERAGKISPMAARVSPVAANSSTMDGITEGTRTAAVPIKR